MSKPHDDPQIRELEDLAWSVKDQIANFYTRALPATDRAVLASVKRDLERVRDRVAATLNKRKRNNGAPEEPPSQGGLDYPRPDEDGAL